MAHVSDGPASPRSVTVAEVRRSYSEGKRWEEWSGELPALLIFRPISFWITPAFVRLGVSPVAVSLLSGVAALAMVGAAWRGGPHAFWAVAGLGCASVLLVSFAGRSGLQPSR